MAEEIDENFSRLRSMMRNYLDQAKEAGQLREETNTEDVADIVFSEMGGASVLYSMDRSGTNLDRTINSLLEFVVSLAV